MSEEALAGIWALLTESTPQDHGLPGRLWAINKIRRVVVAVFAVTCGRSTTWRALKDLGLSWKKTKKILAKANTERRVAYLSEFDDLYAEMARGERTLIYIDEAHIHQDMDLGSDGAALPRSFLLRWPPRQDQLGWCAYDFTNGRSFLWAYPKCNGLSTADFLDRVAKWVGDCPKPTVIWDGSPVHRAIVARDRAAEVGLEPGRERLVLLPGYSPDLNPIEGLWKWMRESLTYGHCYESVEALFTASMAFLESINTDPLAMIRRLWPKMRLIPEEEALRLGSTVACEASATSCAT